MFKFLKNKLKETVDKFTKKAEEESVEVVEEETSKEFSSLDEAQDKVDLDKKAEEKPKESDDAKSLIHSVDDLISEDKEDIGDLKTEDFIDKNTVNEEETDAVIKKEDVFKSDEIDPLIEEVVERNKSFEEAEQQAAKPEDVQDSYDEKTLVLDTESGEEDTSKKEQIDEEIKEKEIVDDGVSDSDVVEDILPVDTEEIEDLSQEKEKKGFFKKLFGKKEQDDFANEDSSSQETNDVVDFEDKKIDAVAKEIADDLEDAVNEVSEKKDLEKEKSAKEVVHKDLLKEDVDDSTKKKKSFFGKIKERVVKFQLTDDVFEDLFWEFELALLEGNVASEVIEKIKSDLKEKLTSENVSRKEVGDVIFETLKNSLDEVLSVPTFDLIEKIKQHQDVSSQNADSPNSVRRPFVLCMVGVNGSGKTTTLAKLINLFQKNNLSMVVAAADTFRAAAIQQLEEHTTKLGVKLIKHDYNADPAAVAFDAIKHAKSKNIDLVLIDTAGRLQSNSNLMDELKKLIRVNKPDMNIFIGESITGNDCVEQAVAFNEAVGIDGIILSKADIDDKGGAAVSVSYVTKKPILYLGVGQTYDDLKPFNKKDMLETLGL